MRVKYPRTPYLTISGSIAEGDRSIAENMLAFADGRDIAITEKMDGESTSLYRDGMHARSTSSGNHTSRDWLKAAHAGFRHPLADGERVIVENLYAQHSISYTDLPSYANVIAVIYKTDTVYSWDDTVLYAETIGLPTVPVLYRGPYTSEIIRDTIAALDTSRQEGIVVRTAAEFPYPEFGTHVAK